MANEILTYGQYIYKDGAYRKIVGGGGSGSGANVEVVASLPETGQENTIYLIKNTGNPGSSLPHAPYIAGSYTLTVDEDGTGGHWQKVELSSKRKQKHTSGTKLLPDFSVVGINYSNKDGIDSDFFVDTNDLLNCEILHGFSENKKPYYICFGTSKSAKLEYLNRQSSISGSMNINDKNFIGQRKRYAKEIDHSLTLLDILSALFNVENEEILQHIDTNTNSKACTQSNKFSDAASTMSKHVMLSIPLKNLDSAKYIATKIKDSKYISISTEHRRTLIDQIYYENRYGHWGSGRSCIYITSGVSKYLKPNQESGYEEYQYVPGSVEARYLLCKIDIIHLSHDEDHTETISNCDYILRLHFTRVNYTSKYSDDTYLE